MNTRSLDQKLIPFFQRISLPLARWALFTIFFWFGILKVFGMSPASPLVIDLMRVTLPSLITPEMFLVLFGLFEAVIGLLFVIRGAERVAIIALCLHMITTVMPLILLPAVTWSAPFVPTMEGQYIIKNIALIACAVFIGAQLVPRGAKKA
jgi:uncharacterized membrane protein YkgB